MTVFRPNDRRTYRYNFYFKGRRHSGSTGQITREDALEFEAEVQRKLRRQASGLPTLPTHSPRFQDWATTYIEEARKKVRRPERLEDLLNAVLRFWGSALIRPSDRVDVSTEPFYDLRLADPLIDPLWLERFEELMEARGIGAQTRNHYRSIMSRMYRIAMRPKHRSDTGISVNPWIGVPREKPRRRTSTVTVDELRAWMTAASSHVRLAVAIAALAPKLRLQNVLTLRFDRHLDRELTYITIEDHKTQDAGDGPLVVPISNQLRTVLKWVKDRRSVPYVVTYRDRRPVKSIRAGLKAAAEASGLVYGRDTREGVTFHTIRHSMATLLAELGEPERLRMAVMGHTELATTQRYTHLRPVHERPVIERLSKRVKVSDLVVGRPVSKPVSARKAQAKTAGHSEAQTGTKRKRRRSA